MSSVSTYSAIALWVSSSSPSSWTVSDHASFSLSHTSLSKNDCPIKIKGNNAQKRKKIKCQALKVWEDYVIISNPNSEKSLCGAAFTVNQAALRPWRHQIMSHSCMKTQCHAFFWNTQRIYLIKSVSTFEGSTVILVYFKCAALPGSSGQHFEETRTKTKTKTKPKTSQPWAVEVDHAPSYGSLQTSPGKSGTITPTLGF